MTKLAIAGCCGKMGTRILEFAQQDKKLRVVSIFERAGHASAGKEMAGLKVADSLEGVKKTDVLIDFTSPESTVKNLEACLRYKKAIVIGTTGLSEEHVVLIRKAAKKIPVVFSPNMSVGVNLLFKLLRQAASKLSQDYKTSIREAHHVHKKDAPSGTAKKLAQIVKEEKGEDVLGAIESIREGEIVGDHEVVFDSPFDTIKLSHSAKTRDIFAKGALVAAQWLHKKKTGLYSMEDVLA